MDFIDLDFLKEVLQYGFYSSCWGCGIICLLELFVFAVVKAFSMFRHISH